MGRSSKEQAARNRMRVVDTAVELFQQHGLDGVGIAELMRASGMTHGAFYRQFASKDDVAGEACARAMASATAHWRELADAEPDDRAAALGRIVERYLAGDMAAHRCAMPSLAADVAREPKGAPVRAAYTDGVRAMAGVLSSCVPDDASRALSLLAAMVGAVALARALDDPALVDQIMQSVRDLVNRPPA